MDNLLNLKHDVAFPSPILTKADDRAQDSCPPQALAAPGEAFQGVDRSGVHEEDLRRRGAVHGFADWAVALSIDEKTQIQALGRTQKGLQMKAGRPATMTHEDKRTGTTTLFAAEHLGRNGDRPPRQAPPAPEVYRVPRPGRPGGARRPADPRRFGLLLRPQASGRHGLADGPSPMELPLHADLLLLDECRRGLLREAGSPPAPARRLRVHRDVDPKLHRAAQRERGEAFQMDDQPGTARRRPPMRASNDLNNPLDTSNPPGAQFETKFRPRRGGRC